MSATAQSLLDSALTLPESERLLLAARLLESVPADIPLPALDDPRLLDMLDERFSDLEGTVPLTKLWDKDDTP